MGWRAYFSEGLTWKGAMWREPVEKHGGQEHWLWILTTNSKSDTS